MKAEAGYDHVYVHQVGPDQEGFSTSTDTRSWALETAGCAMSKRGIDSSNGRSSLWLDTNERPVSPSLEDDLEVEVAVGGGITGAVVQGPATGDLERCDLPQR